jgi:hypothetical protein
MKPVSATYKTWILGDKKTEKEHTRNIVNNIKGQDSTHDARQAVNGKLGTRRETD